MTHVKAFIDAVSGLSFFGGVFIVFALGVTLNGFKELVEVIRRTRRVSMTAVTVEPPPRWLSDEQRSQLRLLKRKTGRRYDQQVLIDALSVYEWVIREYDAGRDPLPGFSEARAQLQQTRAIRLRNEEGERGQTRGMDRPPES